MSLDGVNVVDYFVKLERRVARLERTSSVANSATDVTFVGLLTITGLNVNSQTVVAYGTDYQVYVKLGWSAVDLGSDTITDDPVKGYYTSWTKDGVNYTAEAFTDDTEAVIGPMAQGQTITFRVRCVTQKDTFGPYASVGLTTSLDNVAPLQTSTPVAIPYLGQVRLFWDGKDVSNAAMSNDTVAVQIHMSTTGITFTPTPATLVDIFYTGGGYYTITGLTYGTTYYFRLVAVDKVGNLSPVSTGASVVPVQAADGDIANLSIGKLTVGSLSADMTVSARIKTANTGPRTEMNTAGFEAYNGSGTRTFYVEASTGNVDIIGTLRTGATGQRIIVDPATTSITFFPSSGTKFAKVNGIGVDLSGGGPASTDAWLALASGLGQSNAHTDVVLASYSSGVTYAQYMAACRNSTGITLAWSQLSMDSSVGSVHFGTADNSANVLSNYLIQGANAFLVADYYQIIVQTNSKLIISDTGAGLDAPSGGNAYIQNGAGATYFSANGDTIYGHAAAGGDMYFNTAGSGPYIWSRGADNEMDVGGIDHLWLLGLQVEVGTGSGGESFKSLTVYNNTSTFAANVGIATAPVGTFWRLTSSAKYKVGIEPLSIPVDEIMKLIPVTYYDRRQYDDNGGDYSKLSKQVGFIAEQVAEIPQVGEVLVERDEAGLPEAVNYERGVALLLMVVRDLVSRVAALEGKEVKLVDLNVPQEILDMTANLRWPATQDTPLVREERDPTWIKTVEPIPSSRV